MSFSRPAWAISAFMITSWTSLNISTDFDVLALDLNLPAGRFLLGLIDITLLGRTLL